MEVEGTIYRMEVMAVQNYVVAVVEDELEHLYIIKYAILASLPAGITDRMHIVPILLSDMDISFLRSVFTISIKHLYPNERFSDLIVLRNMDLRRLEDRETVISICRSNHVDILFSDSRHEARDDVLAGVRLIEQASSPEVGLCCWLITLWDSIVLPQLIRANNIERRYWNMERAISKQEIMDKVYDSLGQAVLKDIARIDFNRHPNYPLHLSRFFFDTSGDGLWRPAHLGTYIEPQGQNRDEFVSYIDKALKRLHFEKMKLQHGTMGINELLHCIEQYLMNTIECLRSLQFPIRQPDWGNDHSDKKEEPFKDKIRIELRSYCQAKAMESDIHIAEGSNLSDRSIVYGNIREIKEGLDAIISKARKNAPGTSITLGLYREPYENNECKITLTIQDAGKGFKVGEELTSDTGAELSLIKMLGLYYCRLLIESSFINEFGEKVKAGFLIFGSKQVSLNQNEISDVDGTRYTLEFKVVEAPGAYPCFT
jgi:hypothetical protein